jgi:hypothetical protein
MEGRSMHSKDIVSSLFWLLLGLVTCWGGYRLEIGTLCTPDSGFLIFGIGILIAALTAIIFIRTFLIVSTRDALAPWWSEVNLWKSGTEGIP